MISETTHKNKNNKNVKSKPVSSLKSKLLAKLLLKPSMWLSCAQPNNQTLHQSTFYFAPSSSSATNTATSSTGAVPVYASMIETNLNHNALNGQKSEQSHDDLVIKSSSSSSILHSNQPCDTGYETLSTRYDAEFIPPASALFQVTKKIELLN